MFNITTTGKDYVTLVLTHKCNKNCSFCIDKYRNKENFEMSIGTVHEAIAYANRRGIKDILLVGGEPTLHSNLRYICKLLQEKNMNVILTSNFDNIDIIKLIDKESLVDSYNFSIYNDKVFTDKYDFIKDLNGDVTLSKLLHDMDLSKMLKIMKRAHELNTYVKFSSTIGKKTDLTWLDNVVEEEFVLFDEIIGQRLDNAIIKRYDKPIVNPNAFQSMKFFPDGTRSIDWDYK